MAGDCSLREAVNTANASADIKAIQFSALFDSPQTITLTNGQIAINQSMSIVGKGANLTAVSGGNATRIFLIAQNLSNVTISGLTMANGRGGNGAGLRNLSTGVVDLTNCAFINNIASSAYGGGIEDVSPGGGSLNITGCTFSGNVANEGGAIKIQSNVVNVTNTTISGNTGNNHGGGIANYSGTLTLTSSTITGNTTNGAGSAGGLVNISAGATSTVRNSIISGNTGANPDVSGNFTSGGYNFIGKSNGSTGFTNGVNNDQAGTVASPIDPLLLPLGNYGGKTRTHALSLGSPAVDKGFRFGSTTDQRGLSRPFDNPAIANAPGGDGSDIGAFEAQITVVMTSNFNPSALGQTVVFTATVLGTGATPTGTLNFFDGATPLCSAVGLIAGQATCVFNNLPTGLRSITAGYSGDANYGTATSPPYMQTVGGATSRILTVTKGGTGSGTVTSNPSGITCGTDCTEPYANPTLVTLTATPTAGSVFMGWLGACVGTVPCSVNVSAATSVSATFAPSTVLPRIDIDGNNAYDAATDGLLMIRYLFGFTGASLTNGAIGTGPARSSPTDIAQYMDNIKPIMDVDGNGQTDALTDGLMLLRHLLGLQGPSLTNGAIGFGATRPVADISSYIQSIRP